MRYKRPLLDIIIDVMNCEMATSVNTARNLLHYVPV